MRPSYPIARNAREAMTAPKGFAKSEIEVQRELSSARSVVFKVELSKERFRERCDAEAFFAIPLSGFWGELCVDLDNFWRCWISYFQANNETAVASSLSAEDRTYIEERLSAAPAPKRSRRQKGLDIGLFEVRDPDRPGWTLVSDE